MANRRAVELVQPIPDGAVPAYDAATGIFKPVSPGSSSDVLARLKPRGAWVATTVYAINDEVIANGVAWRCITPHTSGASFSADAAKWERFGVGQVLATGPPSPSTDDLWYDKTNDLWKRWNGTAWVASGINSYLAGAARAKAANMPAVIAHRGGGDFWNAYTEGPYPENTMLAFEAAVAAGCKSLNFDVQMLSDGALVLMHDQTVNRTTNGTGNVMDFNTTSWRALSIITNQQGYNLSGLPAMQPPLFEDVLRRFGGRVHMLIETISWHGELVSTALCDLVDAYGLRDYITVQSGIPAQIAVAAARGYTTQYQPPVYGVTGYDAASILAAGAWATGLPKHVDINFQGGSATQAQMTTYVQSLVTAGLTVSAYVVNRKYDVAWLQAAGVSHFITAEPIYLAATGAVRINPSNNQSGDPSAKGVWPHGIQLSDPAYNRGRGSISAGSGGTVKGIALDDLDPSGALLSYAGVFFIVTGDLCPISDTNGNPITSGYTIQTDIFWSTIPSGDMTRHADLTICSPDDRPSNGASSGAGRVDGYVIILRGNGQLGVYRDKQSDQSEVQVGSTQTTGLTMTAGMTTTLKAQVTSTQIIVSVIQGGTTYGPYTFTDSTYRGGYFHIGKQQGTTTSSFIPVFTNRKVTVP